MDTSKSSDGILQIRNKQTRCDELVPLLEAAISQGTITPCTMPSFVGKLQFADALLWGRAGRMALRDLRSYGHLCREPVKVDATGLRALRSVKDRLLFGMLAGPRSLSSFSRMEPWKTLMWVAALPPSGLCCLTLAARERLVFGCKVPEALLAHWRSDGGHHVIGLVELYAAIVALRYWRRDLEGRRVIVDNWPALDALVRGDASVATWRELLLVLENPEETAPFYLWTARVPSKSNVANGPSRGSIEHLATFRVTVRTPVCPCTKQVLRSIL